MSGMERGVVGLDEQPIVEALHDLVEVRVRKPGGPRTAGEQSVAGEEVPVDSETD